VESPQPDPGEQLGPAVHDHRLLADVEPLDVTGIRTVSVGTVLFVLGGLALLPFHGWLEANDRVWWLWTCVAGFGLGVFGFEYCRRRARHLRHEGRLDLE
jgi:hypothetical protein